MNDMRNANKKSADITDTHSEKRSSAVILMETIVGVHITMEGKEMGIGLAAPVHVAVTEVIDLVTIPLYPIMTKVLIKTTFPK